MRVLITGSEGYIGCLLAQGLIEDGHDVTAVDTGFYKSGWLYDGVTTTPQTLVKDIRHLTVEDLEGIEAVVHLAELSNDPVGDLVGEVTYEINHEGTVRLARIAKQAGVSRFVYMSSCSVYGVADGIVDETSPVSPQTAYAHCKVLSERDLTALADDSFSPTFMRNATAFGASPRQRFDVVLPNLCGHAWVERRIAMTSDGEPWRPLAHVLDLGKAVRMVLQAPRERVHAQALNVGSDDQNYRVREIAEIVASEFPGCELSFGPPGPDNRSYRVSFAKIREVLPGFECDWDARAGVVQMRRVFEAVELDEDTFFGRGHTRLKQIEHLMKTGQVDQHLFWTSDLR